MASQAGLIYMSEAILVYLVCRPEISRWFQFILKWSIWLCSLCRSASFTNHPANVRLPQDCQFPTVLYLGHLSDLTYVYAHYEVMEDIFVSNFDDTHKYYLSVQVCRPQIHDINSMENHWIYGQLPVGPRNAVCGPLYRVQWVLSSICGPQIRYSHSLTYSQLQVLVTINTRSPQVYSLLVLYLDGGILFYFFIQICKYNCSRFTKVTSFMARQPDPESCRKSALALRAGEVQFSSVHGTFRPNAPNAFGGHMIVYIM
jgi:hypothetical protein